MLHLKKNKGESLRLIFFFVLLILIVISLVNLPRLAFPLTLAYIIYLVTNPAIPMLQKFGLSRGVSIGTVFLSIIFFSTYPVVKLVPTVTEEAQKVQYYLPKVERFLSVEFNSLQTKIKEKTGFTLNRSYLDDIIVQGKGAITAFLLAVPPFLASAIEWVFLVPLFVFFFLKDGRKFKMLSLRMVPNSLFERTYLLSHQFNKKLGDYIFAKFIEASIVGLIITTGLWIMDVRFSLLLGLVAGITNIIPYVGPVIGIVPALIFGMAEYGASSAIFGGMMFLYLTANAIDLGLVFPILVSKIVDLHPIIVVASVILGSQYMGVAGMVVSIPLAAAAKLIFLEVYKEVYAAK